MPWRSGVKADFVSNEDDHALIARSSIETIPVRGHSSLWMASITGLTVLPHGVKASSVAGHGSRDDFNPAILDVCACLAR